MKKILPFAIAVKIICCIDLCQAQFISIPDTKFAAWLNKYIPAAMNGNQMDTTHADVLTRKSIEVENDSIYDLTGIQYFSSLRSLDCGNGYYSATPNRIQYLPPLPLTLDTLICGKNLLDTLPVLPPHLRVLKCYSNPLGHLPALPPTLNYLDCSEDSLGLVPSLPDSLYFLACDYNQLIFLPALPSVLAYLSCDVNSLKYLPKLPSSLNTLSCRGNLLSALPSLPVALNYLNCNSNHLTGLPVLPLSLFTLECAQNQLSNLPSLPNTLTRLECSNNTLNILPVLPASLGQLYCGDNKLSSLPFLPAMLGTLYCEQNQLTSLPALPAGLVFLSCSYNQISCFPVFPQSISYIDISNNPFTCLPNYIYNMDAGLLSVPLCLPGNPNGCPPAFGIVGFTYKDQNANCNRDASDDILRNIPVQLLDSSSLFLGKTFTAINGVYDFPQPAGKYIVGIDTIGMPFAFSCPNPGVDSVVTTILLDTNVNFAIACKPGFDVGVQSISNGCGLVFPGLNHNLNIVAGDMSRWFNLNCASGISGQVQIEVNGPANYVGPAPGATTPIISGNLYTYTIPDFALVNNESDFNLIFQTMTTAQAGDMICASVTVTPTSGDYAPANNTFSYCYFVKNSHDPNVKEVFPAKVNPGYADWFTYTIHFQNTGTAPAMNIRIADTLDDHLDISTFQILNYSHANTALLMGKVLTISFPNINLADSTSNKSASMGFIQYRIKPKKNITLGTQINNTAYIYFDYNEPIITNNAWVKYPDDISAVGNETKENELHIFPNPASDFINVNYKSKTSHVQFEIMDVTGRIVSTSKEMKIDVSQLAQGLYLLKVADGEVQFVRRFVKN